MNHITVLQTEAVEKLSLTKASRVVDCTLGSGGHSRHILESLGQTGHLISIDADPEAVTTWQAVGTTAKHDCLIGNFRDIKQLLGSIDITSADAILADLGWRTDQFQTGGKGFSFLQDEPLLMTFGNPEEYQFTAYDIVNTWEESSIADIIYGYGEERAARKIAYAIVTSRLNGPITTAKQLASLIEATIGHFYKRSHLHPATKTFQALRIAVNDELGALEKLLNDGLELLEPGGRFAIISFHSLEDRLVKRFFRQAAHDQVVTLITKKPIVPTDTEISQNPRARSAKLRVIEKLP